MSQWRRGMGWRLALQGEASHDRYEVPGDVCEILQRVEISGTKGVQGGEEVGKTEIREVRTGPIGHDGGDHAGNLWMPIPPLS